MWLRSMVIDNIKASIPFVDAARLIKRRMVPYTDNASNSRLALTQGLDQIRMLRAAGAVSWEDVLEIGTGWVPTVPLLFHIAGARSTVLADIERLMDDATVAIARRLVIAEAEHIAAALEMTPEAVGGRLAEPWNPTYLVPWDIAKQAAASVDIVVSRAVFEHIPEPILENYLRELQRIVRPGGMMCHVIDNSDHWEHRDKSISRLNFLRFDDGLFWKFSCFNKQNFQNRMRHSDYIALFERTGWQVVAAVGEPDATALQALRQLPLAAKFRAKSHHDLAILTSGFVVQRGAAA